MVDHVVFAGVIAADSSTVPDADALIRTTNDALLDAPAPLKRTPTLTQLILSVELIAAGVASRLWSSIWFNVLEETKSVASLGVTSSTAV